LFYNPVEKPTASVKPPARNTKKTVREPQIAVVKPPAQTKRNEPSNNLPPQRDGGEDVSIIPVGLGKTAPVPTAGPALGLKYSVLKLVDGKMVEVDPNATFHAGDRIRLSIMSNTPGYLYIIHQASSGIWKPMFPSPEVEDGNNFVEGRRNYDMPPKTRFFFDEQPGIEKLFVVLSRTPEPDLEKMIYNLRDGGKAPTQEPVKAKPERPNKVMPASAGPIENSMVGRMRDVYARDLIIEKVDDATSSAGTKEQAIYVVNPSGSADSRVVADIRLNHK